MIIICVCICNLYVYNYVCVSVCVFSDRLLCAWCVHVSARIGAFVPACDHVVHA